MLSSLKLNTGAQMPSIGFGFWKVDPSETPRVVREAIETGYRHLDCACDYGNEAEVGQGLREVFEAGTVKRDDLWVTSKLWNTFHAREHVRPACEKTLKDLGLDYLDLYLIHFPIALKHVPFDLRYPPGWVHEPGTEKAGMEFAKVPLSETWAGMEQLVKDGLVKHIGICNYNTGLLADLLNYAEVAPSVLQVESHPYLVQEKLLRFCRERDIAFTAFSPLGALSYFSLGMASEDQSVIQNPVVTGIAERLGRTPAQVLLRWGLQRGTAVIPKTSRRERMVENMAILDFELTPEDMTAIAGLDRHLRFNDPGDFGPAAFNTFCPIYD